MGDVKTNRAKVGIASAEHTAALKTCKKKNWSNKKKKQGCTLSAGYPFAAAPLLFSPPEFLNDEAEIGDLDSS